MRRVFEWIYTNLKQFEMTSLLKIEREAKIRYGIQTIRDQYPSLFYDILFSLAILVDSNVLICIM